MIWRQCGTQLEEIVLEACDQYTRQGDAFSLAILNDTPVPMPLEDAVAKLLKGNKVSKVKNQHYVPQFYLKRFTRNGDHLFVFDKFDRKSYQSNVSNVASERYFYDFPQEIVPKNFNPQVIEETLSEIEMHFSNAIEVLLGSVEKFGRIYDAQKPAISLGIAIQILRTREFRDHYIELVEKLGTALLNRRSSAPPRELKLEFNDKFASLHHAMLISSPRVLNELIQALNNHIWLIGINETTQPFYTSDAPVVKRAHKTDAFVSYSGYASEGIEIAVPLSPKHVLILCERMHFSKIQQWDCKTMSQKDENVMYYNSLQVFQCHRQVYCSRDAFGLAERICVEHPEVCSPDRPSVQIE